MISSCTSRFRTWIMFVLRSGFVFLTLLSLSASFSLQLRQGDVDSKHSEFQCFFKVKCCDVQKISSISCSFKSYPKNPGAAPINLNNVFTGLFAANKGGCEYSSKTAVGCCLSLDVPLCPFLHDRQGKLQLETEF